MKLDRARDEKPKQRLGVLERTPFGPDSERESVRDLHDKEIGRVSDRRARRDLIEDVSGLALCRQPTHDDGGIDDRLSECHGSDG